MSGTHELMQTRGAGFSLVGRDKHTPEDRWALAELDGFVIGAVADGISDPLGSGLTGGRLAPSGSGAVADEAVGAFVERASRLVEGGEQCGGGRGCLSGRRGAIERRGDGAGEFRRHQGALAAPRRTEGRRDS